MNGYQLTRQWFEWRFNNPGKLSSAHAELYFYIVDRWNYFGQKSDFGLPRMHTMEVLSIGSRNTYKKIFNDLIEYGFIKLIRESSNQYHHASIIALSKFEQAPDTPLDTPTEQAHEQPSEQTSVQAPDPIVKPNNQQTNKPIKHSNPEFDFSKYGELSKLIEDFAKHRKSIKKPFMSQHAVDLIVKKLKSLSQGNYQLAEAIIDEAIASGWQGIFLPKNQNSINHNVPAEPVFRKTHECFKL